MTYKIQCTTLIENFVSIKISVWPENELFQTHN